MRLARRGSRSGRVDELDTRSKREKKAKEKAKPGTRLASKLSLVHRMRINPNPQHLPE